MLPADVGLSRNILYVRSDVPKEARRPEDYLRITYAFGINARGYAEEGTLHSPVCVPPKLVTGLPQNAYRKAIVQIEAAKADQIRYRTPTWALRFVGNTAVTSATIVGVSVALGPIHAPTIVCAVLASLYLGVHFLRADYKADTRVYSEARCFALALNDMVTLANTGKKEGWMHETFAVDVRRNINPQVFDAAIRELDALGYALAGYDILPEMPQNAIAQETPLRSRLVSPERIAA